MIKKQVNQNDIASNVARITGLTKKVVLEVLKAENDVIQAAIAQGFSVKNHKLYRIEIEEREERQGYDGINDRYYTLPERKVLKLRQLSMLDSALEDLNEES